MRVWRAELFDPLKYVSETSRLPVETFDWGTLQWLCNSRLFRGAEQTVGLCHIKPGCQNQLHYHPNCEEVLHLLAGVGQHRFEDDTIELRPGMTLRIPLGVTHNLANTGTETLVCLISFNTGKRETVFLDTPIASNQ
ncbi:MAG TPA: cupin domain-containing protein [Schlesneria sp.]